MPSKIGASTSLLCLLCCFVRCGQAGAEAPTPTGVHKDPVTATPPAKTPAAAQLQITVRDGDDLSPMPARVLFTPVAPTKMPNFQSDGSSCSMLGHGALGVPEGLLLPTGEAGLSIPPGTYDLMFLQGPEYEAVKQRIKVADKQVLPLDITLSHSVRTGGWMAADMHIHSTISYDSTLPTAQRVVSEVASGIALLVPTEHAFNFDLSGDIVELGYQQRAVSVPGGEYGFAEGHAGVYPAIYDSKGFLPNKDYGGGAPSWQHYPDWLSHSADVAFPEIHALPGNPLVVVNHPRLLPDLGYFTNIGWPHAPGEPLATADLFDAMEVLNGYENDPADSTLLVRDWFNLLNGSHRIAALGNSDTHRVDRTRAGYPRTWLRLATDQPSQVLPGDLKDALLGMRAIASNGPFVNLWVNGYQVGDTVTPAGGQVSVRVVADAPGWIDITQVQLYQNGVLLQEIPITQRHHPALEQELTVPVTADGWLVAMVIGDTPLPAAVIGTSQGDIARPFAFTNPIWLDQDGDGKITITAGPVDPQPFGPMPPDVHTGDSQGARILPQPQHAPLDCDPALWPKWLQ